MIDLSDDWFAPADGRDDQTDVLEAIHEQDSRSDALLLIESRAFRSGITLQSYRVGR